MKRRIILSFLILIGYGANAQMEIDKRERLLLDKKDSIGIPSYKWLINLSADYNINSNAITNSFIKSLYNRSFIDDNAKDRETKRLKKYNRLGADEITSINGVYNAKKLTYVFGLTQRIFAGTHFSNDLFELVFRGNSDYAGINANLNHTHIQVFDYQSLYFGVQKQLKEGKYTIGASGALIRGGQYHDLTMKHASLYTDAQGQSVSLNGDLNFSQTPSDSGSSALKSHGKGASVNLFFSMKTEKGRLNFEVRDIGFITWQGVKTYSGNNASYQYNGLLINDILSHGTNVASGYTLDSIAKAAGIKITTQNRTMFLPTTFNINYVFSPNKKFSRTVGVRYMLTTGYIPRVYVREADFLGKGFTLVNSLAYGGFGRLDYELGLLKKFKNSFIISVNLFAFEYLVLPGKSSGNGFNFGLTKLF
jgi:hypothetical protein